MISKLYSNFTKITKGLVGESGSKKMTEQRAVRLRKAASEFNVGTSTITELLSKKGYDVVNNPNTKLTPEMYSIVVKEFQAEKTVKEEAAKKDIGYSKKQSIELDEHGVPHEVVKEEAKKEEETSEEAKSEETDSTPKPEKTAEPTPVVEKTEPKTEIKKEEKIEEVIKEEPKPIVEETKVKEKKVEEKVETPVEKPAAVVAEEKKEESTAKVEPVKEPAPEVKKEEVIEKPVPEVKKEEVKAEPETKKPEVTKEAPKAPEKKETKKEEKPVAKPEAKKEATADSKTEEGDGIKVLGKIDLENINTRTKPVRKTKEERQKEREERDRQRKASGNRNTPHMNKQGNAPRTEDSNKSSNQSSQNQKSGQRGQNQQRDNQQRDNQRHGNRQNQHGNNQNKQHQKNTQQENKPKAPQVENKDNAQEKPDNFLKTKVKKLEGPTILGKIDLGETKKPAKKKPVASSSDKVETTQKKRKRIRKPGGNKPVNPNKPENQKQQQNNQQRNDSKRANDNRRKKVAKVLKEEPSEEEIQKQIKDTLARLSSGGKSKGSKHRRSKRDQQRENRAEEMRKQQEEKGILKVTEFVTVNELATMMDVPVTKIIGTCMTLGLFVSINQRLDAETINVLAEEFGYKTEFVSVEVAEAISDSVVEDAEEDLSPRSPIVTVMGHVDHGKTSLLDYIRKANVIAGEAGGITQHIGAYEVKNEEGKRITFLDTPGHEAFTAMRARGAKITDVAIIVVAADDTVMPQTIEAINHAQAAGVPIVFAINKIDRPSANPDKIKEELSKINILVEDWGGKYQSQEISAKQGIGIDDLLEKVLLEAEMLDLKGNANRAATGTILESSLDKGRGYVAKILVQNGTMKIGDMVLAGSNFGKVKAMYNERNQQVKEAGPSAPVLLLGLNGAPQAGDNFNVMVDEKEAKQIATKRTQLQREQGLRTQKHITLDEIGRRIAIGDFQELNIIVKGDVDGSVEALSDSMMKLSTDEVQVNVIHKSVGQVTETDVMLASASDAIIVGFQVRPSVGARKLAESEQIDIRTYSVIYKAIEEIKDAIEGMLSPDIQEKIVCNIEIRETFKISKVGTIAGCMVLDGLITRNTSIRLIRDGIVIYTGKLGSLKRFKDDAKEVKAGFECGLNIENFNDIKVGDIIEGYEKVEVARKLS
jgi:translation initiation factor IF-2